MGPQDRFRCKGLDCDVASCLGTATQCTLRYQTFGHPVKWRQNAKTQSPVLEHVESLYQQRQDRVARFARKKAKKSETTANHDIRTDPLERSRHQLDCWTASAIVTPQSSVGNKLSTGVTRLRYHAQQLVREPLTSQWAIGVILGENQGTRGFFAWPRAVLIETKPCVSE